MKKKRDILLGLVLILITLVLAGWIGGLYLSPQACVEDSLRGLYFNPAEKIAEAQIGDQYYYLYANDQEYALHGARKTALFFYRTTGGNTGYTISDSEHTFDVNWLGSPDVQVFVVHRNTPDIQRVEISSENGELKLTMDLWHQDFAMLGRTIRKEEDLRQPAMYRAYDKNGDLVEERQYP